MKGFLIITICFLISISAASQSERWKQKNARINIAFTPQFEYVKIAGNYNPTVGLAGSLVFNNTYYLGGYLTKKMLPNYQTNPLNPITEIDVNYQHLGMELMYALRLGLYRTKGGHYVHPKLRILFGTRFGGGALWLDDLNKTKVSSREYFFIIQPEVGVAFPLNDFITLHGGACFAYAFNVGKYYDGKDFTGPGAFLSAKITIFR